MADAKRWEARGTLVYFGDGGIDLRNAPDPENRARLIATAPELLRELDAGLALFEGRAFGKNARDDRIAKLWLEWADRTRATIAKATGSAS